MNNMLQFRACVYFMVCMGCFGMLGVALSISQTKSEDLYKHPVYSGYLFGKEERVIDFGTQPLAAPMGVITEVMKHDKIFREDLRKKNREIRFHPFYKGADINFFIRSQDIEAATLGDAPAITIAATYEVILAALAKQGYSSLIAREPMLISDLKGKKVGFVEGSTAHYNLLLALHAAGMKESDIVKINMEVNELPDALEKGRIDAFSAWEPIPSETLAKYRNYVTVQKFLNSSYLIFTKPFLKNHPGETLLLMASYLRALRWMKKDEKNLIMAAKWYLDARREFEKKPTVATPNQIATITKEEILKIAPAPYIPIKDFEKEGFVFKTFEFLKTKQVIRGSSSWEKVRESLNRSIMEEVLSNTLKYRLDRFDYEA